MYMYNFLSTDPKNKAFKLWKEHFNNMEELVMKNKDPLWK